jgi:transcriptional regulator of acetoin/glycerol metabolism
LRVPSVGLVIEASSREGTLMAHRNARLTEFGRLLLVQRITELGWPVAQAAESLGVSRATTYKWLAPLPSARTGRAG